MRRSALLRLAGKAQQSAPCAAVRAGWMWPPTGFRVIHLSATLAAVLLLVHVQVAWGSCQKPITPQEGLTCETADVDSLKSASPDMWWTFTTPPEKYVQTRTHPRTHTHTSTRTGTGTGTGTGTRTHSPRHHEHNHEEQPQP